MTAPAKFGPAASSYECRDWLIRKLAGTRNGGRHNIERLPFDEFYSFNFAIYFGADCFRHLGLEN
jgi:hypothetical protein